MVVCLLNFKLLEIVVRDVYVCCLEWFDVVVIFCVSNVYVVVVDVVCVDFVYWICFVFVISWIL